MLQINNLVKSFGTNLPPVLAKINFNLQAGEFCVLLGSNGSGKSTLLKCISGEYAVDQGEIKLAGTAVQQQSLEYRARVVSSVAQNVDLGSVGQMTLLENMALSMLRSKTKTLKSYKRHTEIIQQKIKALNLGLEKFLHVPLGLLSGGQRQMLATLMALISQPQLLLLDEHTSALDPQAQQQLMAHTVQHVYELNITTLMITHNLKDALRFGDRIILLHKGALVLDVKGAAKQRLSVAELLGLFHHLESSANVY